MALDRLTKIDGGGISTTSDYRVGVITATKFVGPIEGSITATDATFSGNVSIAGTLTYEDVINVDSVGVGTFREGIFLPDNKKLQFGNAAGSADLEIFHSSSENKTIIDNNTNDLDIASDVIRLKNSARSETLATFIGNGGVSLYYDNSVKLGTAGWGIQATGILKIADATDSSGATNHLALGASNDLKLFHDGSHNRIHGSTGFLDIYNSADLISITASNRIDISDDFIRLRSRDGSDVYMTGTVNSSVDLYFNGSKKFETTNSGVTVTGSATASTFTATNHVSAGGNIVINSDTGRLRLGASNDLELYHNGSNSYIQDNGTGALLIGSGNSSGAGVYIRGKHGEESIICNSNGSVDLYYDNSKKFATSNTGATVTGSLLTTGNISINNVAPKIFLTDSDSNSDFAIRNMHGVFGIHDSTNSADRFYINSTGNAFFSNDLDVDGHTELDNVAIAGVTTHYDQVLIRQIGSANSTNVMPLRVQAYRGSTTTGIATALYESTYGIRPEFVFRQNHNGNWNNSNGQTQHWRMVWKAPDEADTTDELVELKPATDIAGALSYFVMKVTDNSTGLKNSGLFSSQQILLYANNTVGFRLSQAGIGITDTIYHDNDTDTKIRFHANDKFRIELGGITSAFSGLKSTSGAPHAKWGINVHTPQAALHIDEGYNHQGVLRVTNGNQGTGYYHQLEMSGTQNIFTLWRHYDGSNFYSTHAHGSTGHRWYISGNEKVRIHSDGNVGIATNNPGAILDVLTSMGRIKFNNSGSMGSRIDFANADGTVRSSIHNYGGSNEILALNTSSTINFNVANSTKMKLASDGKIGIGEDDPDGNYLLIRAASTVGTNKGHIMLTGDSATIDQGPQIVFAESGATTSYAGGSIGFERKGGNSQGDLIFGTRGTQGDASTTTTERLRITSAGRVGIGSDNPVAHLDVANYQNIEVLRLRDRHFNKYLTIRGGGSPNRMVIDSYEGGGGGAAIDLASNGSTKLRITSAGLIRMGNGAEANTEGSITAAIFQNVSGTATVLKLGNTNTPSSANNRAIEFCDGTGGTEGSSKYTYARIKAERAGGSNSGRLILSTKPNNNDGPQKAIEITPDGDVLIGNGNVTTQEGDGRLIVYANTRLHPAIKADCIDGGINRANGFTMLADNYQADESLTNIGVSYSGGGLVLSRGVKVSNASDNVYLSSVDSFATKPCALKLDTDSNLTFLNTNTSATTTTDSAVTLTERFRITSMGDVYAGNETGYAIFDNSTTRPRFQFRQGTGTNRGFALIETRGDANSMALYIAKSREGNGTGVINAGDQLGSIQFTGADGTNQVTGAQILAYTQSTKTVSTDRMPTNLSFYTHDDNTAGKVERLRIFHDGRIAMSKNGWTGNDASFALTVHTGSTSDGGNAVNDGIMIVSQNNNGNQNSTTGKIMWCGHAQTNGPFIYAKNAQAYGKKDLVFHTRSTANDYTTQVAETLRLTYGGNVGINEPAPDAQLVVRATSDDNPAVKLYRQSGGGDTASINWVSSVGTNARINYRGGSGNEGMQFSTSTGNGNQGSTKERFRINHGNTQGVKIFVLDDSDNSPTSDKTAILIQNGIGGGDIGPDSMPTHIDWAWQDANPNDRPQCRISGNVGNGGDPNSLALEGKGFLTFHCSDTNSSSYNDIDPPQRLRIAHNGTFTGSSSNNISDQRLKENIAMITDPIAKIKALKGRTFTWKTEASMREGTHYGFIAQEVESVIPDLIVDDTGIRLFDKDDNLLPSNVITPPVGGGYAKSVDADGVTPVLVEALKEALSRIETLEAEVAALKSS